MSFVILDPLYTTGGSNLPTNAAPGTVATWNGYEWVAEVPVTGGITSDTATVTPDTNTNISSTTNNTILTGDMTTGWVARIANNNADRYGGLTMCSDGVIVAGGCYSQATFYSADGTEFKTQIPADNSVLTLWLVKYDKDGNVKWAARCQDTNHIYGGILTVDSNDNIYMSFFTGSGTLRAYNADGSMFARTYNGLGNFDVGLVSYDRDGQVRWLTHLGSFNSEYNGPITIHNDYLYLIGNGTSSTTAAYNSDGTQFPTTVFNDGGDDVYMVKYSLSGMVQWLLKMSSDGADGNPTVSADTFGVYATLAFAGHELTAYNAGGTAFADTLTNDPFNMIFWYANCSLAAVKYNHDGVAEWIAKIGAKTGGEDVRAEGKGTVYNNDLYLAVNYKGNDAIVYHAGGAFFARLPISDTDNIGLVKYNKFGQAQFAHSIGSTGMTIMSMKVNQFGIYIAGYFSGATMALYNFDGTIYDTYSKTAESNRNSFVANYSHDGVVQWATMIHGNNDQYPVEIALDNCDVYINAVYSAIPLTITLPYGSNALSVTKSYDKDNFVAKFSVASQTRLPNPDSNLQKTISLTSSVIGSCAKINLVSPAISNGIEYNAIYLQNNGSSVTLSYDGTNWIVNNGTSFFLSN